MHFGCCVIAFARTVKALLRCGVNVFLKIIPPLDDKVLWRSWLSSHCRRQQGSFEQIDLVAERLFPSRESFAAEISQRRNTSDSKRQHERCSN